jgi:hypothetical protein
VTFCLFVPAQLFRAMRTVRLDTFDVRSIVAYFGGALLVFLIQASEVAAARDKHASVTGFSLVFSNTVLLGIPLIKLAWRRRSDHPADDYRAASADSVFHGGAVSRIERQGAPTQRQTRGGGAGSGNPCAIQ